jgi:hypothetical protein
LPLGKPATPPASPPAPPVRQRAPTLLGTGEAMAGSVVPTPVPTPTTRSDAPPPDEGWSNDETTARVDARSIAADLRAEVLDETRVAIDAAVAPLQRAIQDLWASLEQERGARLELAARVAALASAPAAAAAPVVSAEFVSSRPVPRDLDPFASASSARSERAAQTLPPTGRAPTLNFDTSPYPEMPGMLDGDRRKKMVTWFVTVILVVLVGGIGLMTIFSYAR